MPRRKTTGANLLTMEELMAKLNMTKENIMQLVENNIPHIRRNEPGVGVYYLFPDKEVLAIVKPLPPIVVSPPPAVVEEKPTEAVYPDPPPMATSTASPGKVAEPELKPKEKNKTTGENKPTGKTKVYKIINN